MPLIARWGAVALVALALLTLTPAVAAARGPSANTAALQVALKALHHYHGGIDGLAGPGTKRAVRSFQRRHHLAVDGVPGPRTRRALGKRGRPSLGSRVMGPGDRGWDVAALQFMLRRRGFSAGSVDGGYGPNTTAAVRRFQSAARIGVDGHAGRGTLRALRHHRARRHSGGSGSTNSGSSGIPSGPVRFLRPVRGAIGEGFGYPPGHGGARHDGIDFPEPMGTPIGAAGVGTVISAGWNSGGYGNLTIIQHRLGYQTYYAHQSSISVSVGQQVSGGVRIGYVGTTGHSTGPHLHFEVRHNGVPINPVPLLLAATSLGKLAVSPFPPPPASASCAGADRTPEC
jgi:peptidoglycan hydrolase-like protein with peptidoglycan-binding domain